MRYTKIICPKCSHHGAARRQIVNLPGCGRKEKTSCDKCGQVFYYTESAKNTAKEKQTLKKSQYKF